MFFFTGGKTPLAGTTLGKLEGMYYAPYAIKGSEKYKIGRKKGKKVEKIFRPPEKSIGCGKLNVDGEKLTGTGKFYGGVSFFGGKGTHPLYSPASFQQS